MRINPKKKIKENQYLIAQSYPKAIEVKYLLQLVH